MTSNSSINTNLVFLEQDLRKKGIQPKLCLEKPALVNIDLSSVNASFVPGVGEPNIMGLNLDEAKSLVFEAARNPLTRIISIS